MKDREKKLNTGIHNLLDKHSMFVFNDNLYYIKPCYKVSTIICT